jgi:orotate phosphoribosyltransferase
VVTTGGSVKEVIGLLEERKADVVGVGSIVDRTGGQNPFRQPYLSLKKVEIESFAPEACPLCKEGIPVTKPGSRGNR